MTFLDAVRIALGLVLLPHFILKVPRVSSLHKFYERARLPAPRVLAPIGFVIEGAVVVSLLLKVQPRIGAILGFFFLLGAAVATVRVNGLGLWRWEKGGPEYPLFLAALLLLLAVYS